MTAITDLKATAEQERLTAEDLLTRAGAAERRGDGVAASTYRDMAALCHHQAEEAETAIKAISEIYGERNV